MRLGDRYYLTEERFKELFSALEELQFEVVSRDKILRSIKEQGGSVPYQKKQYEGMEKGYMRRIGMRELFVWPTFVPAINDINEHDLIWIVMVDKRSRIVCFWFPIKRTANFLSNTLEHVEMFVEMMRNWPTCPECDEELYLRFVPGIMHLMQYVCGNSRFVHSAGMKRMYPIFNMPLSDKNSNLLFAGFKRSLEYQHKISLDGKPHQFDRTKRAQKKKDALQRSQQQNNFYGDIRNGSKASEFYDD